MTPEAKSVVRLEGWHLSYRRAPPNPPPRFEEVGVLGDEIPQPVTATAHCRPLIRPVHLVERSMARRTSLADADRTTVRTI